MDKNQDSITDTVVGPSVKIQGDLNSEGNIRIEGNVSGKVQAAQSVIVGETAQIMAEIIAGACTIAGSVQGNIKTTGTLTMQSTARVTGDIVCAVLRVEDGALFSGKCTMGGTEKPGKRQAEPEPEN